MKNVRLSQKWFAAICMMISFAAYSQKGSISGTVTELFDGESEAVPFANVYIKELSTGASTDFEGKFSVPVEPGTYHVVVSFVGYLTDESEVIVGAGEDKVHDVVLKTAETMLTGFTVEEKVEREGDEVVNKDVQNSSTAIEAKGGEALSEQGASNVEDGATKFAGISKQSGGNIFVRGMGDRYNNATLNGLPIPSPNPDKKVIPLSIFPTSIVERLSISKTFNSDMYADFAGGTIDIRTKRYAQDTFFLEAGAGVSINTQTTFRKFRTTDGDGADFLGHENGDRMLPTEIANEQIYNSSADGSADPFPSSLNSDVTVATPSTSLNVSFGGSRDLAKKEDGKWGYVFSASHGNGYSYRNGKDRYIDAFGLDITNFAFDKYSYTTGSNVFGSFYFQPNLKHNFTYNLVGIHTSDNTVSIYDSEIVDRDRQVYLKSKRNSLFVNTVMTHQLLGEHDFSDKFDVNWGVSYSTAKSDEPDRSEILYKSFDSEKTEYFLEGLNASDNYRFFGDLDESEFSSRIDGTLNIGFDSIDDFNVSTSKIKFGAQTRIKSRDYLWRQLNIRMDDLVNNMIASNSDVKVDYPEEFLNEENFGNGLFSYSEQVDPSREHSIYQNIYSSYIYWEKDFIPNKFKMLLGARSEFSQQTIRYKSLGDLFSAPYRFINYDTLAILPNVSLKYSLNDSTNLRFAASQTLSRPGMKELSPFQYQVQSGALYEGNPFLVNGINYNVDFKYERFSNNGGMFALGLFGKYLDKPIERAQVPSSGILFSYFNMGNAVVGGAEVEMTKNMGSLLGVESDTTSVWNNVKVGFNAAYLYSKMTIGDSAAIETNKGTILATNNERPMFGASPFIVNANVGYKFEMGKVSSTWTLAYNVSGKKVFAAGTFGRGDIYELPVQRLDFILRNNVGEKWDVNLSLKNLLNPKIVQQQTTGGVDYILNEYRLGRIIGLSLTYKM